jgi:UDP-3-O-[3-hydroxymyristoyl] glucosamine N-acyltransferase
VKNHRVRELRDIIPVLEIRGSEDREFYRVSTLSDADEGCIVWIKPGRADTEKILENCSVGTVVCDSSTAQISERFPGKTFVVVDSPKLAFLRIISRIFKPLPDWGAEPSAVIHPEARIHPHTYIGPNAVIGRAQIGEGTVIHANCTVYDKVRIGCHVTVNANTVIGSEGFGYSRNEDGEFELFPHMGGVEIGDHVDIGSNTSIDRGTLGDTIIGEGVKIDNLVHIAHNVVIGKHSAIIANSMLGGSVSIGDFAWVAPSAAIMNQITLGAGTTVGVGAVVTKSVPEGETWAGVPARPLKEFVAIQRKLSEL